MEVSGMSPFTAETFYKEFLPEGEGTVYVAVTVTASGDLPQTPGRAEVVIVDNSGSMGSGRKLPAAQAAATAAVDCLEDGVAFAVVAGNDRAEQIWPRQPGALAIAGDVELAGASRAIGRLFAHGGTAIGRWLDLARELLEPADAGLRHVILLSDGKNQSQSRSDLEAATEQCRDVFQCDCRGVGTDWEVADLRLISDTLHGQEDMFANIGDLLGRDELVEDFRSLIQASQAKVAPDVRLRVVTRDMSDVDVVRQHLPKVVELTARPEGSPLDERATEYQLGAWAPHDQREYFVALGVKDVGELGDRQRVARLELVLAGEPVATSRTIEVEWTDDAELSTQVVPEVERHLTEDELAREVQAARAAYDRGDQGTATMRLANARKLAKRLGDQGKLDEIDQLIDVDDETGTVKLRKASRAAWMQADIHSTSMRYRLRRPTSPDRDDGGPDQPSESDDEPDGGGS
jgi:hypothetical protein